MDMRDGARMRRQMGFFNPREVADLLGVNFWTYYDWIERGLVPRPLARLGRSYYYTRKDVEEIKDEFEKGTE